MCIDHVSEMANYARNQTAPWWDELVDELCRCDLQIVAGTTIHQQQLRQHGDHTLDDAHALRKEPA